MKQFIIILFSFFFLACYGSENLLNSFKPGTLWLDTNGNPINAHGGGIIFVDGIYYWYGEHKLPGKSEEDKADGGVHCYSSIDLYNWNDEGLVLSVDWEDSESDLAAGCILERPKVIFNDLTSKYMMYFKLYPVGKGYEYGYLGIAISNSPLGPFEYSHRLLAADSPYGSGDFCIFKDQNGDVYHYAVRKPGEGYAGKKAFVTARLNEEYTYPKEDYIVLEDITKGTEAPAIIFNKGNYFMLGSASSGWRPNAARSFVSFTPTGPFANTGNPCSGTNPHNEAGPETTFGAQSSFIFPVQGKENAYVAMFDIWKPEMPIEGLYVWLPLTITDEGIKIEWQNEWDLSFFK